MSLLQIVGNISETSRRESVEFEWKLENFFGPLQMVDVLHSPAFSISNRYFYLQLYPNGNGNTSKGWISLYLVLGESCPAVDVQYSLAIKKADGKTKHLLSDTDGFSEKGNGWGTDEALERAELLRRREELTSSGALTITATLKTGVPHPMEDFETLTLGKLRESHCTQFCKELLWEIDEWGIVVSRFDEKESFACWSPPYAFGTQLGKMRLRINADRTEIGLFMPSSIVGYMRWRAGILRADGTEEWTGSGQTILQEDRPDKDPFGVWIGPSRREMIRQKMALTSGGVLTFSVQISTQKAVEDFETMILGKLREGHCTQFCKELIWEIDDVVRRLDGKESFACWSPPYIFGTQQSKMRLCINDDRTEIELFMPSSIVGYLRWRAGILRADGTEEWTGSGQTLLQEGRPDKDPFGAWFGPSRSQLIRQKDALLSKGVLTFSVQMSTQEAVEGATGVSVIKTDKVSVAENRSEERQPPEITGLTTLRRSLKDLYVAGKDCENVTNVYYIADKYDLPALKEVCVPYMLSNLTVDSVCRILALASRHDEEVLLKKATEFFVENARAIFRTDAWPNFMKENTALANDLIIQIEENMK